MGKNAICVSGNGARLVIIGKMVLFFSKTLEKRYFGRPFGCQVFQISNRKNRSQLSGLPIVPDP